MNTGGTTVSQKQTPVPPQRMNLHSYVPCMDTQASRFLCRSRRVARSTSYTAVCQLRTAGTAAYIRVPGQEQLLAAGTQLRTAGTAAELPGVTPVGSCETPGLCETDSPSQSLSLHIGLVVKRRWPINMDGHDYTCSLPSCK